jgi:hypothetical protein
MLINNFQWPGFNASEFNVNARAGFEVKS